MAKVNRLTKPYELRAEIRRLRKDIEGLTANNTYWQHREQVAQAEVTKLKADLQAMRLARVSPHVIEVFKAHATSMEALSKALQSVNGQL